MPWRARSVLGAAMLALVAAPLWAQQVYRQVDANGRVTFSDKAPSARAEPTATADQPAADPGSDGALPYELRQVVQRYPVTLYTRSDCQPCDAGRNLLTTRGVPYTERTVNSAADTAAMQRMGGQGGLPVLSIGSQQLQGFLDSEWSQYLDAAGYPRSSQLPPGYRQSPPQPLVALAPVPAPAAPSTETPAPASPAPAAPPPVQGPTADNPAGIRF